MRIAVISDTHMPRGGRRLPARCVEELRNAELILHAGDVVTWSVLEELERLAPVEAVHGNMDERELVERLPGRRVVDAHGIRIGIVHDPGPAPGRAERLAALFPGCGAVVYGHTHLPVVDRWRDVWMLNPGSPTERRRAPVRSMLLVHANAGQLEPALLELPA